MKNDTEKYTQKFEQDQFDQMLETLRLFSENTEQLAFLSDSERINLFKLAGHITRPDREETKKRQKEVKKLRRQKEKQVNREARRATGIRSSRDTDFYIAPAMLDFNKVEEIEQKEYLTPHDCYVCRTKFTKVHHFYDSMCQDCAELNYYKRYQKADLTGQVALITGSRLKIGYQATLLLLRAGATVIATTRFPVDSAMRFSKEPEFKDWGHRLHIYGLDLRHTPSVEIFAKFIEKTYDRLDILINNAAQTVRRPSGFYSHMMENERMNLSHMSDEVRALLNSHHACIQRLESHDQSNKNLPIAWHTDAPGVGIRASAELSQIPYSFDNSLVAQEVFPEGKLDLDHQQVDLRTTNSWRLRLGEVQAPEMLEVQLVNSVAPFVLINRLIHLMRKENTGK